MLAGGAFCKPAERNYSPIEGEATALFKGLKDTKYYTLRCKRLHVATDHQPLVTTLSQDQGEDHVLEFQHDPQPREDADWADAILRCKPLSQDPEN